MGIKKHWIWICIVFCSLLQCTPDEEPVQPIPEKSYKIAIMLPLTGPDKSDWNKATDWVCENLEKAGYIAGGKLEPVWYDTYNNDIETIAQEVFSDTSIKAAIGPLTSSESFRIANQFIEHSKPLLLPTATSADISSAFSGRKYIWRLVESDISQCQAQLIIAKNKGARKVALVTGDDPYGMTFYNWFGFLATEMNLEVTSIEKFDQDNFSSEEYIQRALATNPDLLVAVPRNTQQAVTMAKSWQKYNVKSELLFSDAAYLNGFIEGLGSSAEGMEGTAFAGNPATGFDIAWEQKYQQKPTLGMAQVYDAMLLLGYALELSGGEGGFSLASALMTLSDGTGASDFWDKDGIRRTLTRLKNGEHPQISGASGTLKFADDVYTDIVSSTYVHWQVYDQQFLNLSYYASSGEGRISRLAAAWQYYASKTQDFDTTFHEDLPALQEHWALIVATTRGWSNYRHQADALRVYHLLRNHGWDDDHIILCMTDDLAEDPRNKEEGKIFDAVTHENLYQGFQLDYKLSDLNAGDILNILSGNSSTKLTKVINSTQNDNILVYFIGHGDSLGLIIQNESTEYLKPEMLKTTLTGMKAQNKYRRILFCIESCYSGIFEDCNNVPSVLFITAANRFESSKSVVFDADINAWLSDQFTNEWLKLMQKNTNLSFSELYLELGKSVYGSHVSIYNADHYGNVYKNGINEFINQ